jgi:hypothetical protein
MATGEKTQWGDERLDRLFKRYNRIYWGGRLPRYRVRTAALDSTVHSAHCDPRKRIIEIDPSQCASDRVVRSKLLHEMVHAAIPSNHDLKFCAEIERLLRLGAPYMVEAWDCSNVRISEARFRAMGPFSLKELIPRRLPLLRRRMQRLDNRRKPHVRSPMT